MVNIRNILIILILIMFAACDSDKPKTDSDSVDKDTDFIDADITTPDPDIIDIDNEKPDVDTDIDTVVPCLDLRYNENTIKTAFPFKDKNGKPTFCRLGCDTPTETDPQCVRNIWEWDNWEEYQVYLEAEKKDQNQEWERECYPWPCKLPDMKAYNGEGMEHKCDRSVSVNNFFANGGAVWSHGMSDGVAGIDLTHTGRAIEYNLEKDEFLTIGQSRSLSFSEGRYVIEVFDQMPLQSNYTNKGFVISVLKKEEKYYYELIYDNKDHNAFLSNSSFSGKDWVLIQVRDGKNGTDTQVKYAKAGEWEWHDLGLAKVEEGNIVGNHLTFMVPYANPDRQVYYCDLSKYPKSYKDCTKVTKTLESGEAEQGHSPRIDEDNENRLVYYIYNKPGNLLKEVIFKDGIESKAKEYPVGRFCQPSKIKNNLMMFTSTDENLEIRGCWYRFDKQKSYCPLDDTRGDMLFPIFDKNYQIWKNGISTDIRDWDCYCKEEGVCPFEE